MVLPKKKQGPLPHKDPDAAGQSEPDITKILAEGSRALRAAPPDASFAELHDILGVPRDGPISGERLAGVDLAGFNPGIIEHSDLRGAKLAGLKTTPEIAYCVIDSSTILPVPPENYWISFGAKPNSLLGGQWRALADELGLPTSIIRNRQRPLGSYEGSLNVQIPQKFADDFIAAYLARCRVTLVFDSLNKAAMKMGISRPAKAISEVFERGGAKFEFHFSPEFNGRTFFRSSYGDSEALTEPYGRLKSGLGIKEENPSRSADLSPHERPIFIYDCGTKEQALALLQYVEGKPFRKSLALKLSGDPFRPD